MGSRQPSVQVVQPPPPQFTQPPSPDVRETSRQLAQSRLEFDPQILAQQYALQRQYAPQFAGLEYDVAAQQLPLYRALIERQFPQLPVLAGQVSQQLASPASLTPEHAAAQEAIRERARERLTRGIREAAAVGGTLYGGRRIEEERRGLGELEQAFAAQDIDRIRQQRAQTLSELATLFQLGFPQVQQPGLPSFGQVTPSPDVLLQGMFPYAQPAIVGFGPSAAERNLAALNALGNVLQGAGRVRR